MKLFLATVLSALALSAPAFADPAPPPTRLFLSPSGEPFHATPTAPDPLKTWFEQADAKHQGFLDKDAFRADAQRFFKRLDANNDGVIDGFEIADYEHKIVPEITAEAEGRSLGGLGPGAGPGGEGGHRGHGRGEEHPAPGGGQTGPGERGRSPAQRGIQQLIGEPEPVSGADFNLDSHITLDEWMRATDQRFDILDERKDGKLTLDELRARFTEKPK